MSYERWILAYRFHVERKIRDRHEHTPSPPVHVTFTFPFGRRRRTSEIIAGNPDKEGWKGKRHGRGRERERERGEMDSSRFVLNSEWTSAFLTIEPRSREKIDSCEARAEELEHWSTYAYFFHHICTLFLSISKQGGI